MNKSTLKHFLKLSLLLIFFLGFISATFSQTMVSGIVTDYNDEIPLPFANIIIKGTSNGTATNLNGEYRLPISAGTYTLVASFMGYVPMEKEIKVEDKQTITLNFSLKPASIMGEEVLITAMMRGQRKAINSQLNAAGIVNTVSEEQIQELPDANAGEALGRLPGISLKRSGGEAQNIVIRGLNEGFSMIQLNGVPIPPTGSVDPFTSSANSMSENSGSRGVDLSIFSLSSMAGIEVSKALTPDQDADAIAGTVNMVTKKAPLKPSLRIDAGGGYNMMENSAGQYNLGMRYGRRLFSEILGVQLSLTSEKKIRSSERYDQKWDIRPDSSWQFENLELDYRDETRRRTGGSLLLDINTPEGGVIRINNFYNRTDRDAISYGRDYPISGNVLYTIRDTERYLQSLNNSVTGENYLGKLKISWGGSHALSIGNTSYDHEMTFWEGGGIANGMMNIPPEFLKGPGESLIPFAYNNFETAYLRHAYFRSSENRDRDLIAYMNIERSFNFTDEINISLKAGGKYRDKDRSSVMDVSRAPYWVVQPQSFSLLDDGTIVPANYSNTSFANPEMVGGTNLSMSNFLQDPSPSRGLLEKDFPLNPLIDALLAREWYEVHRNGVSMDGSLKEYPSFWEGIQDNYKIRERISAGFAMATINLGKMIRVIGGVRIEQEKNNYTAKYAPEVSGVLFGFNKDKVADTVSSYTETYVLPNVHLRFKPVNWFDLRLAATKGLARPGFNMRLPTVMVNRESGSVRLGNTDLKTTEAWNYDAIASFYESRYGLFTIGVFYKQLDNIFYNLNNVPMLDEEMEIQYNLPTGYGGYSLYKVDKPVNTQESEVMGIEFDLQANLKVLPGFLGNFVLRGNLSLIKSSTHIPRFKLDRDNSVFPPLDTPVFFETKERLEGQPSTFGNIALGYDQGGFSGRLSVYFQDDYPSSVSITGLEDRFQYGYSKWDLAFKQSIEKYNTEIMLNITNLSNMYDGSYYGFQNLDRGSSIYDILVDLGVRVTF